MAESFETATLITRKRNGGLHGRPMMVGAIDRDGTIWFVTSIASVKVDEVSDDSRATVTFQGRNQYLCLNGSVDLVFGSPVLRTLWKESYRPWCEHAGQLAVALLRFAPHDGEYWDANTGLSGRKHTWNSVVPPENSPDAASRYQR